NGAMGRCGPHACRAWRLLVQFSTAQRAHRPPAAAELDLSPAQVHILRLLEPGSATPMGRLATALSCDASNVTGLVDRLEARGLTEGRRAGRDGRAKVVQLTPDGARARARLTESDAAAPLVLNRLSADEQRLLVRLLERLID